MKSLSFTVKSKRGLLHVLETPIEVFLPGQLPGVNINAIWDTGATGSAITTNVANHLGLKPTGVKMVNTANGAVPQRTFTIDIGLPNRILVENLSVTEVPALSGGVEALIGMDIITLGDFSITNHNGITCMSFRIPSSHEIDYVQSPDFGKVEVHKMQDSKNLNNIPKVSRNALCPCNSGKKYKACHGKGL